MLALVVDTSAYPRAMSYKCFNESISLTTRMQPYLESLPSYTDGAPPWTPINRGPRLGEIRDRGEWVFLMYSLRRILPRLSEPTPRPKVRPLALAATAATHPRTPTQARLGECLSPKGDNTSLKTKTLRLSESSSAIWGHLGCWARLDHQACLDCQTRPGHRACPAHRARPGRQARPGRRAYLVVVSVWFIGSVQVVEPVWVIGIVGIVWVTRIVGVVWLVGAARPVLVVGPARPIWIVRGKARKEDEERGEATREGGGGKREKGEKSTRVNAWTHM
ncbi:hypothetical protein DEO72_LG7g1910 [Vigna unguiculata]|uniref:Uncharacterized protein n=1 Tax=Vigna unguiculata TaxID=3917 RepID=A0A4D6MGM4_VIGUN|nr:hypothetical protein DEO72_LG7g1910 [Vigna unguiculata]